MAPILGTFLKNEAMFFSKNRYTSTKLYGAALQANSAAVISIEHDI
jgi:hypothetical protein